MPALLTSEECQSLLQFFEGADAGSGLRSAVRLVSDFVPVTDEEVIIADKIRRILHQANTELYHFDIEAPEEMQLVEYTGGQSIGWHIDIDLGTAGEMSMRKLSATVQLSAETEYEGGDLQIWGSPLVSKMQGSIVIFPAFVPHRVTSVTKGVRRALLVYARGVRAFR